MVIEYGFKAVEFVVKTRWLRYSLAFALFTGLAFWVLGLLAFTILLAPVVSVLLTLGLFAYLDGREFIENPINQLGLLALVVGLFCGGVIFVATWNGLAGAVTLTLSTLFVVWSGQPKR